MIKQLQKVLLLLCALIVGGSAWAQAPVNTVLWSENWTGATTATSGSDSATPSANIGKGTTVYNSGTVTYTQSANTVYVRNENTGGGTAPELLLSSGKTWTISNIPTGEATELSLTYTSNNTKSSVTCSTSGASISGSSKSYTITTGGAETITLVFSCSGNTRIDDVSLKVKTAGTSSSGVAAPTFTVSEGAVAAETAVGIETETDGATIYYTLDGTAPSSSSTEYTGAITITTPTTIKAIAIDGDNESSVSTASYTIIVTAPTFSASAGTVMQGTLLTITAPANHTIIYTTDNTEPSYENSNGEFYSDPIAINNAMTVKAISVDKYDNESAVTSATYTVTIPGAIEITPTYSFFGKESSFSGSTYDEVTGTQDGVTVTYTRNSGSLYANNSAMRFYKDNNLKFEVGSGYSITSIELTMSTTQTDLTSDPTGYNNSTKTWTGNASTVTLSRPSNASSYAQITKITIVLAAKVDINENCVDGISNYYATYSSSKAFKVPSDVTVSEIKVIGGKLSLSSYSTNDIVPANTGVLISSATSGVHYMPVNTGGSSKLGSDNMLKASGSGITASEMSSADAGCKFYRLTMHNGTDIGFWWGAADGSAFDIAANKAYLAVPTADAARIQAFWFEDEVNGIDNPQLSTLNSQPIYSLSGQRVEKAKKGLYIVNGKKCVIR